MTYCIIDGYTRKYYKTINVAEKTQTFTQPTLTANGTLGGTTFAVSASSENQSGSNPYRTYEAFDNNSSTYWRCTNTTSGWIQFYNPNPLYVTSLTWGYFYSYPTGGSVQASNDGNTWTTLKTWTNSSAADFVITINSNIAYKYHRINVTGVNKDVVHCTQITITATELLAEAYSYETDGTEEDYDRYVDFPNLFSIVNGYTRKYYKTVIVPAVYEDVVLPKLTSNTSYGTLTASNYNPESTIIMPYCAFDGDTSTWWETGRSVTSANLQWVLPEKIIITGIKIQVRMGDRPNLTARVYTSSNKTVPIGDSITTTTAGEIATVQNIPDDGIETAILYFDCSSTQDYLGINEVEITAKKLLTEQFSYEIEGTADDYDRYEDVLNILGVEIK